MSENGGNWLSRPFIEVNFLKQTKLNYRLLECTPAAGLVKCSQGTIFVKFVIFSVPHQQSVSGSLRFNNGLKSELGEACWGSKSEPGRLHPWKVTLAADPEPSRRHAARQPWEKEFFPAGRSRLNLWGVLRKNLQRERCFKFRG